MIFVSIIRRSLLSFRPKRSGAEESHLETPTYIDGMRSLIAFGMKVKKFEFAERFRRPSINGWLFSVTTQVWPMIFVSIIRRSLLSFRPKRSGAEESHLETPTYIDGMRSLIAFGMKVKKISLSCIT
jgi:hypothetical protein